VGYLQVRWPVQENSLQQEAANPEPRLQVHPLPRRNPAERGLVREQLRNLQKMNKKRGGSPTKRISKPGVYELLTAFLLSQPCFTNVVVCLFLILFFVFFCSFFVLFLFFFCSFFVLFVRNRSKIVFEICTFGVFFGQLFGKTNSTPQKSSPLDLFQEYKLGC